MPTLKSQINRHRQATRTFDKIKMRVHLNADALFATIREDFAQVPDHRASNVKIPLADALMSGFAMFSLKDQSLLDFDNRRILEPASLHAVYGVGVIPCDSQMRTILDPIDPSLLRRPFRSVFHRLQRGKALPGMTVLDGHLLLSIDGSGFHSSEKIGADYCLTKKKRNGAVEYHLQMLAGAFVHPDRREVIPVCPEIIRRQDGTSKNDCERNAGQRFLDDLRREHPHLKIIVLQDGLSSHAPHIRNLMAHNLRYLLSAKPGDHAFLFRWVDEADQRGEVTNHVVVDPEDPHKHHCFRFVDSAPLNQGNQDLKVNFLEYWEVVEKDGVQAIRMRFSWVTDIPLTTANVVQVMRCGRARWRIENEVFNTLKNQGYNLGHNYGLGKQHLSAVFTQLMMLAFLVDQVQQMCCPLFQAARERLGKKARLWELIRGYFHGFTPPSMETILLMIIHGRNWRQHPLVT